MKTTFFATLSCFLLAACSPQVSSVTSAEDRLLCGYSNHYFRVSDGISKWEKYVSNPDGLEAKVECGEKIAAGLIGSYFVFFSNGKIKDKYVGTFPENRRILTLRGESVAAIMGSYFLTARDGGEIVQKYVASSAEVPAIAVSKNIAAAVMGSYFVVSDGERIIEKYVGSGKDAKVVVGSSMAAALIGSYFVTYIDGEIKEKYVGGTRVKGDSLERGKTLIAASMGNYFVVLDSRRKRIQERYVGRSGKVQVIGDIAIHLAANGTQTRYNSATGSFD